MFNGFRWNIDNEIENKSFVDPKRRLVVARATDWPFCNSVLFLCPNFVENPSTSVKRNQIVLLIKCCEVYMK